MLLFFYSKLVLKLVYFHFGTFCNFKHYYLFFIKGTMKSYFPKAVSYNRFVELESRVFFQLMFFLNLGAFGRCTGITFVDSTMIPVCHNLRIYANKVFKGIATDGKGTMGWSMRKKPKQSIMVLWLLPQNPTMRFALHKEPVIQNFLSFINHMSCSADTYVSLGGSNGCADQLTNWSGTQKVRLGVPKKRSVHGLSR